MLASSIREAMSHSGINGQILIQALVPYSNAVIKQTIAAYEMRKFTCSYVHLRLLILLNGIFLCIASAPLDGPNG